MKRMPHPINSNKVWEDRNHSTNCFTIRTSPPPLLHVLKITIFFPLTSIAFSLKDQARSNWISLRPHKSVSKSAKMSFICTLPPPSQCTSSGMGLKKLPYPHSSLSIEATRLTAATQDEGKESGGWPASPAPYTPKNRGPGYEEHNPHDKPRSLASRLLYINQLDRCILTCQW